MFEKRYQAKTQFDLYEQLAASLKNESFREGYCRVFIFREAGPGTWEIKEFLETNDDRTCRDFSETHRFSGLYVLLDGKEAPFEVTFYSSDLTLLSSFEHNRLTPIEFEDSRGNEGLKKYDQSELKKSVGFLKSILS